MSSSKMAMSATVLLAIVVVFAITPSTDSAITCSEVIKDLRPCVNYLVKGNGSPPSNCCAGASNLASAATTTVDKRTACNCIKSAAKKINPKPQLAQSLPANCGISLPYTVSPNVDCSKIN